MTEVSEDAGEGGIAGTANLLRLQIALLGLVQFVGGHPVAQEAVQLFLHGLFHAPNIFRIADSGDGKAGAWIEGRRAQPGANRVRKPLLLTNSSSQTRRERPPAEDVIA